MLIDKVKLYINYYFTGKSVTDQNNTSLVNINIAKAIWVDRGGPSKSYIRLQLTFYYAQKS